MFKRRKGIDEFKIARAFAVVAVMVALYGISVSATALIGDAPDTGARPGSFWAPRSAASVAPQQREARDDRPGGTSFWVESPSPASSSVALRLAGEVRQSAREF
jgi:hypothetical protein